MHIENQTHEQYVTRTCALSYVSEIELSKISDCIYSYDNNNKSSSHRKILTLNLESKYIFES